ncbi:hypothetical protein [uncultured Pseudoteredinibacter sp.]|uniref:hypothetical protein n=1 Tax=uncultured Pseudoteredinibacter sp. TaxID=1641701 RepID=UPI00260ECA52|nr:hypothetical protein [uncultured Pseudoteredinibacter sp.]
MSLIRAALYPIYSHLPLGRNRLAILEWLFLVIVLVIVLLSLVRYLSPNKANTESQPPLATAESEAKPQISTDKIDTILDQQAKSWQELDQVELVGLVRSNAKQSFAIIRWHEEQLLMSVGEYLPEQDNISITAIATDNITLSGPWGEKRLGLNGKEIKQGLSETVIKLPQLKTIVLEQPNSLADHIQAQANYQNGKLTSLSLAPSTSATLFTQAGLKTGDQLTHINDTPIADIGLSSVPRLLSSGKIELQLNRNGTERQLTLVF